MNIGSFAPLPLCTLIRIFRIYLYIVSLSLSCRTGSVTTGPSRIPKLFSNCAFDSRYRYRRILFWNSFSLQIQTQLFFAASRGGLHSRSNIFWTYFLFHSSYRCREIVFSNYFCYEFGQMVEPPSAIESAIGRPNLALSRIHMQVGVLNPLDVNCVGSSTSYTVRHPRKTRTRQKRDRARDCWPPPRPRLNSQPRKSQRVKMQRAKTSENFAEE